jgi:hypothetical protein
MEGNGKLTNPDLPSPPHLPRRLFCSPSACPIQISTSLTRTPCHDSSLAVAGGDQTPRVPPRRRTHTGAMEQLRTIGRELAMGSQGGWGQSKEFLDLVKSIGEARSKAEEDRIIARELEHLKRRLADPDVPRRKMKELLLRLVYAEMLGHDASFGHIHAVKMTHDESLPLKRTGYLAVALFIDERHDLVILVVNTIQKDLRSDNYLVVCAALTAACRLIGEEAMPAVLSQVVELLAHPKEAVRKKAVMALQRFYQRSPSSVSHLVSNFRKVQTLLCALLFRFKIRSNRPRIASNHHALAS